MELRIKSITEVAFLRASDFRLIGLEFDPTQTRKPTFLFVLDSGPLSDSQTDIVRMDFRNGTALVEPRRFADLLKDTGDVLFDEIRKRRGN